MRSGDVLRDLCETSRSLRSKPFTAEGAEIAKEPEIPLNEVLL